MSLPVRVTRLTLYIATGNAGKLRDLSAAAAAFRDTELLPLPGLAAIPPPVEDGSSFEENARLKAASYSRHAPGSIVLVDDSGLEVDALSGAPGVRSARYAADAHFDPGSELSIDERNNRLLLRELAGVPPPRRTARYRCAMAAARDGECIATADGAVEGDILKAPRGKGGFGYDPLFYLSRSGCTMAEIGLEEKLAISHRGHALRALLLLLRQAGAE